MNRPRNEYDVAKALAIALVVLGHYFDPFTWFPIGSYQLALFFFLSGLLFSPRHLDAKGAYLAGRAKRLLLTYFLYNFAFAVLTFAVSRSIGIWKDIDCFSPRNLFVEPFLTGHQYPFFNAGWFLPALFIVQAVFLFLWRPAARMPKAVLLCLLAGLASLAPLLGTLGLTWGGWLILGRTAMGLSFYCLGHLFRDFSQTRDVFCPAGCFLCLGVNIFMTVNGIPFTYNMVFNQYFGAAPAVIAGSLSGVYMALYMSKALARNISPRNPLFLVSDNTLHIMSLHLLVFFILNYCLLSYYGYPLSLLENIYMPSKPNIYYPVFVLAGLFLPALAVHGVKKALARLTPSAPSGKS